MKISYIGRVVAMVIVCTSASNEGYPKVRNHYAKRALTPRSLNVKHDIEIGSGRKSHKEQAGQHPFSIVS